MPPGYRSPAGDGRDRITRVRVATIVHRLEVPIVFGSWVMRHREFALVRIDAESGASGFAYCLTRDGPIAAIIDRTISPAYVGQAAADPAAAFHAALWSNNAVHASGIGMRALSVVDIAAWDLAARMAGQSIASFLGGGPRPMPVTGIVGYPPSISPEATVEQIAGLWAAGWRRFKLPIAPTPDASIARLRAAREAFPDAWLGIDNNFYAKSAAEAIAFGKRLDDIGRIGWFEDVVPPGDAVLVAEVRAGIRTPVAMGDEQGGSYHPQALLAFDAVDVLRVDATTNGGITRLPGIVAAARAAGKDVAPHMFPHVHSQVFAAIGVDAPIEWGIPGTGVHPMDDSLPQPVVRDGRMEPLPEAPGLGRLVDPDWIRRQEVTDPGGLLDP